MKRIISIILCCMLLLSACSQTPSENEQPEEKTKKPTSSQETQKETTSQTVVTAKPKIEIPKQAEWLDTVIVLSQVQSDEYISKISSVEVPYDFYGMVDCEELLASYHSIPVYEHSAGTLIKAGVLDSAALLSQVNKSTDSFLAEYTGTKFFALSADNFQTVFKIVCEGIEYLLDCGIDENRLNEKLMDLKIVTSTENGSARVTHEDTIMAINFSVIESLQKSEGNVDLLHQVVLHETMHLGQLCSDAEREYEGYSSNLGVCYTWEDTSINPLFWNWYIEGTAEQLAMECHGLSEPTVYETYVKALQSIAVATVLHADYQSVGAISLSSDLEDLFALFGADTKEDQLETLQMMYAFEIALTQSNEFYQAYKQEFGPFTDNRISYHNKLFASAGTSLTKVFYRNMADNLTSGMTLQEVFSLMTAFEVEMSRLVRYTSVPKDTTEFIEAYSSVQSDFLKLLAEYTGYSFDEVQGQYLAWYYGDTLDLSTLPSESQAWVNGVYASRANNKRNTIIEIIQ